MPDRPNVLLVQTDQMRAAALGCMGNDQVRTPVLDRMAEEGAERPGVYVEDNLGSDTEWRALRTDNHVLVVDRDGEPQHFYNTADDPHRRHNLVDLVHDKQDLERRLVDAAKEYDDRYFLDRIGERAH